MNQTLERPAEVDTFIDDPLLHAQYVDEDNTLCGIDMREAVSEWSDLTKEDISCPKCLARMGYIGGQIMMGGGNRK